MPHSALIVEDLPDAQAWLREVLVAAFPEVRVEICGTLAAARAALRSAPHELILVDLNLPDGSGIELLPIARSTPGTRHVLVTTIYDDGAHIFPALRAGAQGYLLKDEPREDLVRQLRSITRGELPLSPSVAAQVMQHFGGPDGAPPQQDILTFKEREVLAAIAEGLTLGAAAERLGISRNTVATHIKHIYYKLNVSSRAEAARRAEQLGIVGQ